MQAFLDAIVDLWTESGLARLFNFSGGGWKNLIMIAVACVLLFLAIKKQFEPLLLLPIAFGMLLVNLPLSGIMDPQQNSLVAFTEEEFFRYADGNYEQVYPVFEQTVELNEQHASLIQTATTASGKEIRYIKNGDSYFLVTGDLSDGTAKAVLPMWQHFDQGGLLWYLYQGVKFGIYPPLIFLGIGAMTDFGPLLSNPKSFLLGAAAQLGIFTTYFGARCLNLIPNAEASASRSRGRRPLRSASSAARTGRRRYSLPPGWRRNCWARSLSRRIPTWRWCRSSSRRSCVR